MFTSAMTLRLCTEIMQQSSFNEKTFGAYNVEKFFNGRSSEGSSTSFWYAKKRFFSELTPEPTQLKDCTGTSERIVLDYGWGDVPRMLFWSWGFKATFSFW